MNKAKRKALESAGWTLGDYGDFLGLTDAERRLIEFRARLARGIREARLRRGMTQDQLAEAIRSTQPRVVKIERGVAGVSLDQMLHAYFAAGGTAPRIEVPEPGAGASLTLDMDKVIGTTDSVARRLKAVGRPKPKTGRSIAKKAKAR